METPQERVRVVRDAAALSIRSIPAVRDWWWMEEFHKHQQQRALTADVKLTQVIGVRFRGSR